MNANTTGCAVVEFLILDWQRAGLSGEIVTDMVGASGPIDSGSVIWELHFQPTPKKKTGVPLLGIIILWQPTEVGSGQRGAFRDNCR
jgi:hypothetical protein